MQTSVANILNNLTIEDVDKTGTIINLTYKDNLTVRAVDLLNNIAKVYLEMELESKIKDPIQHLHLSKNNWVLPTMN